MDVNTPKEFLHECGSRKLFLQDMNTAKYFLRECCHGKLARP
jgi:hypothetical protein